MQNLIFIGILGDGVFLYDGFPFFIVMGIAVVFVLGVQRMQDRRRQSVNVFF
jgi:hypothetical protein